MARKRTRKKKDEEQVEEAPEEEKGYVEPYPATTWLCSRLLMKRGFVDLVCDDFGKAMVAMKKAGIGGSDADVLPVQQLHALSKDRLMKLLLKLVWRRRDRLAKRGDIPQIRGAWQP